ncbi:DUF1631 domain-containing protein [Pseudomonas typographi]|uniref:DUF1631 domain-containing protein n=1 Tax=Pseudomonas typographi TaxID=2715964 RepID=A0ABR7YXJ1_9PSED|nr:DUF1631 domain-containing protein [Pseudomonas typographi]MBD1551001.1 DUF1631 domain-containing protein [Pseudomonas typographi]MBD1597900.1 DUF1631 domain-containing protein [Pseudomonas typographi]
MPTDGKVVPLNAAAQQASNASLARLPVVVLQVRDKAAQQLKDGLQALFDNADDTLFEMADKAHSNAEQNIFFEAMRDLRLKRKNIERGFLEKFYEEFVRVGQYDVGLARSAPMTYDKLALVPNDELERTVALDAMVSKVLARDGFALTQLTTRLNTLIPRTLTDETNPLGPAMLCDYFIQAGRNLGVEIKVKLIILKLFDKYVLTDTDHLYFDANQLLIATGILPELKAAPSRRAEDRPLRKRSADAEAEAGAQAPEQAPSANAAAAALDQSVREVFSALQELLRALRGTVAPKLETLADAQPISTSDLMRLLSHLQQYVPAQPLTYEDYDLRQQLEQLLTRVSVKSGRTRVVGNVDEDVINLVAMLFEFILADRNLPDSLKVLIGRLQIPMLKVAVVDKSFFSRGSHPARRLLNEIAQAAMGWSSRDDYQRDALHGRIEQIVQRLLNDFVDDPALFSELLVDFLAFTADERRRSELLEQRTRDAEEGRARAELARLHVQFELNRRLLGKTLPQVVVRLLEEAWSKVLLLTWLKHGDASAEWALALETMDDLIWSVEPHNEPQARLRLLELVPGLLKSLREGLTSSAFDPFATSEFFSQLETLHVQAIQRAAQPSSSLLAPDDDTLLVRIDSEIVLEGQQPQAVPEPTSVLAADDPALAMVDAMRPGTWVELQEDAEHRLRCKLTTVIASTGKYIFVNRTGMKVLERSRAALAQAVHDGSLRVLDDNLLFDRALDAVVGKLRSLKSA